MNLSDALQTQFADKLDNQDGESSQDAAARIARRPNNDTFLLTQSNLDFLMDYLGSQGDENAFYTVIQSDLSSSRQNDRYYVPRSESRQASRSDDYRDTSFANDRYCDPLPSDQRPIVTLADIQKTFTTILSQLDKHSRQAAKTASPRPSCD
jgi:hypothetical protein